VRRSTNERWEIGDVDMNVDFSAFPNEKYPEHEAITSRSGIESSDVDTFFRGRRRWDITARQLNEEYKHDPSACLGFMTPGAFSFFAPLYLRMMLQGSELYGAFPDSVLNEFHRLVADHDSSRLDVMLEKYSKKQWAVVVESLVSICNREEWNCFHELVTSTLDGLRRKL
jgi:hypothetical protein